MKLWDARTGANMHTLADRATQKIETCCICPSGKSVASGHRGEVKVWNVGTGCVVQTVSFGFRPVANCAFSPDGHSLFGMGDNSLNVWDTGTWLLRFSNSVKARARRFQRLHASESCFSPDSKTILSADTTNGSNQWTVLRQVGSSPVPFSVCFSILNSRLFRFVSLYRCVLKNCRFFSALHTH